MKGYYTAVTEHEGGWGSRHDGYLVSPSREVLEAKGREWNAKNTWDWGMTINDIKLCILVDGHGIPEDGFVWDDKLELVAER